MKWLFERLGAGRRHDGGAKKRLAMCSSTVASYAPRPGTGPFPFRCFVSHLASICLILIFGVGLPVTASEYEVRGTFGGTRYLARSTQELTPVDFTVSVRDCQWAVRVVSDSPNEPVSFRQISFDGRYMYNYGAKGQITPGRDSWGGLIAPEGVPFMGPVPSIPIVWLGLASGCYLNQVKDAMTPPYSVRVVRTPIPVRLSRRAIDPRLAERIVFMDDGYDRTDGKEIRHPAPYDEGFTNAVFTASSFTNLTGIELPMEFHLRVFRPSPGQSGEKKLELEVEYWGRVTDVAPVSSVDDFAPKIPENTEGFVADLRFALQEVLVPRPFEYRTSRWLTGDEVKQLPGFADYLKSQNTLSNFVPVLVAKNAQVVGNAQPESKKRRIVVLGIVVVTCIVPLVFLWVRSQRSRKVENRKPNYSKG